MSPERLLKHFEQISEAPDSVPRLRRFILDLAVRGKIVEQDPADELASELLKRFEAKKAQAVRSGKIRKERPYRPLDKSDFPFKLPDSWQWVRLAEVSTMITKGSTPTSYGHSYVPHGINFLKVEAIRGGKLSPETVTSHISEDTHEFLKRSQLEAGDFLFSIAGSIGTCTVVTEAILPANTNQALAIIRGSTTAFLPAFLQYAASSSLVESALARARGGAMNNISLEDVGNFTLPLPSLAEQNRIVARVDELMALCDELEAAQAKREKRRDRLVAATLHGLNNGDASPALSTRPALKDSARFYLNHLPRLTTRPEHIHQLRQTILNIAVRGKLVPQDPNDEPAAHLIERVREWRVEAIQNRLIRSPRKPLKTIDPREMPYARPDGWAWARLGEVIYIQSGDGLTAANMKAGAVPVYGGNGINGYHDAFNVEESAIVIGRVGYHCGSIHVTPEKAWVTDNAFITKFCSHEIFLGFLVLLLQGTNLKERENATAQPVISGSKIYPIVVGIPPLAEQHRIVAKVGELMALCDKLEARLTTHATARRQLLEATLQENLVP